MHIWRTPKYLVTSALSTNRSACSIPNAISNFSLPVSHNTIFTAFNILSFLVGYAPGFGQTINADSVLVGTSQEGEELKLIEQLLFVPKTRLPQSMTTARTVGYFSPFSS